MKRRYPVVKLDREAGQLVIDWPDSHHSQYSLWNIRAACPCAECNALRNKPDPREAAPTPDARVREMNPVGNYAIQFVWEDGHSFGIYPCELLRQMCPCATCRGGAESG